MAPIIVNSLPGKTGTHLVTRLLDLLGMTRNFDINISYPQMQEAIGVSPFDDIRMGTENANKIFAWLRPIADLKPPQYIAVHHLWNEVSWAYLASINAKMILVVRRAEPTVLSAIEHNSKYGAGLLQGLPLHDQLQMMLDDGKLSPHGMEWFIRNSHNWKHYPHLCVVRFADLVGEKGGGDRFTQVNTIDRVARFLGVKDYDREKIADAIFGDSPTFRVGKINMWKSQEKTFASFPQFAAMNSIVDDLNGAAKSGFRHAIARCIYKLKIKSQRLYRIPYQLTTP